MRWWGHWDPILMASADNRMPVSAAGHFLPLAPEAGAKRPLLGQAQWDWRGHSQGPWAQTGGAPCCQSYGWALSRWGAKAVPAGRECGSAPEAC